MGLVRYVSFLLSSWITYREVRFGIGVISVLFDDAMGFLKELFLCVGQPPIG